MEFLTDGITEIPRLFSPGIMIFSLILVISIVSIQVLNKFLTNRHYENTMKNYTMKQRSIVGSRSSSANSSRQNTPMVASALSASSSLKHHYSSNHHQHLGTPLARAFQSPQSLHHQSSLQLPGLGYNSPFKNIGTTLESRDHHHVKQEHQNNQAMKKSASDSFVFKAPYPVLKDTPRPAIPGSRQSSAPGTPSPLFNVANFAADSRMAAPMHVDPINNQPHWPIGRVSTTSSKLGLSTTSVHASSQLRKEISLGDIDIDMKEQENKRPVQVLKVSSSTKRVREESGAIHTSSPNSRRRKGIKVRRKEIVGEVPPGSVRKSAITVAARRAAFEQSRVVENFDGGGVSKRKAAFEDDAERYDDMNMEHTGLLPQDGFTWIGGEEQRGKRVKLDKDTIVKKRLEYFKSLGVEVPTTTTDLPQFKKQNTDTSTAGFSSSASSRIKLRNPEGAGSSNARIPVSGTPRKSGAAVTSLRKVQDEDDLDELTMKKLEKEELTPSKLEAEIGETTESKAGAEKKTVSFKFDVPESSKEISTSAPAEKPASLLTPVLATSEKAGEGDAAKPSIPAFSFTAPDVVEKNGSPAAPLSFSVPPTTLTTENKNDKTANDSTPAATPFSFTIPTSKSNENNDAAPAVAPPVFNFGAKSGGDKPASPAVFPSFTFSKPGTEAKPIEGDTKPLFGSVAGPAADKPLGGFTAPSSEPSTPALTDKPLSFGLPPALISSANSEKPVSGGLSFGGPADSIKCESTLGAVTASDKLALSFESTPAGASGGSDKPPAVGGFSFGSTAAPASSDKPPAVGGFSFGSTAAPASSDKPSAVGGFSFGSTAAPASSDKPSAVGGFSFGSTAAPPSSDKPPAVGGFSFGSTAAPASSDKPHAVGELSFGGAEKSSVNSVSADKPASGVFSFGAPADKPSALTFGQPPATSTDKPAIATGGFSFGATPTNSSSPAPFFGNAASASTEQNNFSFGSTKPENPVPTFGGFGSTTSQPATSVQIPTPTAASAPAFSFGQSNTTNTTAATPTSFGSFGQSNPNQNNTSSAPSSFSGFGTSGTAPTPFGTASPAPSFSANPSNTTTSFGSSAPPFGASAANNNAQNSFSSSFGSSSQAGNAFGTAPSVSGTNSFQFGAAPSTTSGFNFNGSSSSASTAPPAFGSAQQQQQAAPFQFGASSSAPAFGGSQQPLAPQQQGGFQFVGGTPTSNAGGPAFSFGGSSAAPPTFNQAPVQQIPPGRPILQPKFKGRGPKGRR